jgi:hypothetical protein
MKEVLLQTSHSSRTQNELKEGVSGEIKRRDVSSNVK